MSPSLIFSASAAAYSLSMVWLSFHGPLGHGGWIFSAAYALAYAGMLGIWKGLPVRGGTPWMLTLALAARAAMLAFPASDDVYRYLWEGHIQRAGFNPYLLAPDHASLEQIRTWYWGLIDHRGLATIYFPFSQLLFRAIAYAGEAPMAMKIAVTAFDLGSLALLFGLAGRLAIPRRHLTLYALNPLVILFTAGEGHIESVMVFWILAAVYGLVSRRPFILFGALGLAVMTNVKAIFLVPFLITKANRKFLPVLFIPLLLFIPFLGATGSFFGMPLRFATRFHFNGLLYSIASLPGASLAVSPHAAYWVCGLAFAAASLAVFFLTPDPVRALFHAAGIFILCSPTLHPWYLLILAPALVLYRSLPWNMLMLTVAAVFPVYSRYASTGAWVESPLGLMIEYLPFVLAWIWFFRVRPGGSRRISFQPPRTVSVVIPVLNEQNNIGPCIESVRREHGADPEIIVVDGGSVDQTRERVSNLENVRLLESGPGRGVQIAEGAAAASADVILVLHADSRLSPGSLKRMLANLADRPDAAGGAFGAGYLIKPPDGSGEATKPVKAGPRLRFISNLNNFRARFLGIAFGDQAQFYRNGSLQGGFPALKLMEDVELSLRIKESGEFLFLPMGVESSARRWVRRGYLGNSLNVVWLVGSFLFRRKLGLNRGDGSDYYRSYYGSTAPVPPAEPNGVGGSAQSPEPTP